MTTSLAEICPLWLHDRIFAQYDRESAERIFEGYCATRAVTLRLNPLRMPPQQTREELTAAGISLRSVPWYADAFVAENTTEAPLIKSPLYAQGAFYLQSLSSMLPPLALCPRTEESILDMTAAPGGKTTQIAALTGDRARITACERDKLRFERLKFNVERQGIRRIALLQTDALKLDDFFRFDCILLDAPCSGSGTLTAANPGKISPKLVENSVSLQKKLLEKAFRLLKPGGRLVYSTCSVLREENEDQVLALCRREGCRIEPFPLASQLPQLPTADGMLAVCPDELYEGFFLTILYKN